MFLTKGNDDNLEGRVIIYAELYGDVPVEPKYLVTFASIDKNDIAGLLAKRDCKEYVKYNDLLQEMEESLDFYEQDFFFIAFKTNSMHDLPMNTWDVKYAGASFNPQKAKGRINHYFNRYIKRYDQQIRGLIPQVDDNYKNYPGVFLKPAIMEKYITPLIIAVKKNNAKLTQAVMIKFNQFFDAQFTCEIEPLVNSISNPSISQPKRAKILKYRINKLIAVCNEDYKEAAVLRDKLREIYIS